MTCEHEEYNGWSNRETWAAALMIDNDEGTYDERCRIVADNYPDVWKTQLAIEDMLEELFGISSDYETVWLRETGSQWRIDWHEIASAWIAEHAENNPEDADVAEAGDQ